jgi:hypothetical protein
MIAIGVAIAVAAAVTAVKMRRASVTLTGVVLRQDQDPRKQLPIPNVKITVTEGDRNAKGHTEASGLFHFNLPKDGWRDRPVTLTFWHADYQPVTIVRPLDAELYIIRLTPIPSQPAHDSAPEVAIKDVRVRYSEKTLSTVNVGSTARTFTVPNTGNVPCAGKPPCSPDGKWKAALGGLTIDAGEGQEFAQSRVSCIAGPCPFTAIEAGTSPAPGRRVTITVRNWSDTVTFLVEAEVSRNMPSDAARLAYPAIYGRAMSFTLPATAEGPTIEADLGGTEIVFPLGPALELSWAQCTLQLSAEQTKLYRCELKPGFEFR